MEMRIFKKCWKIFYIFHLHKHTLKIIYLNNLGHSKTKSILLYIPHINFNTIGGQKNHPVLYPIQSELIIKTTELETDHRIKICFSLIRTPLDSNEEKSQINISYLHYLMTSVSFLPIHIWKTWKRIKTDISAKLFTFCKILSATTEIHTTMHKLLQNLISGHDGLLNHQ